MTWLGAAAVALLIGGPLGVIVVAVSSILWRHRRRKAPPSPPRRLVMVLLLVELRAGRSVLNALQETARALPEHEHLGRMARLASVSGLAATIGHASEDLRPVMAQLARAQLSGGSLTDTVIRLLERDLAAERAKRLARAGSLPVKLMIPVTLLMLPGLILLLYAPSLLSLFRDLSGVVP